VREEGGLNRALPDPLNKKRSLSSDRKGYKKDGKEVYAGRKRVYGGQWTGVPDVHTSAGTAHAVFREKDEKREKTTIREETIEMRVEEKSCARKKEGGGLKKARARKKIHMTDISRVRPHHT